MQPPLDITQQLGPVCVTLVYLWLYYAFLMNLLRVKTRLHREYASRGEKFDRYFGQDRAMLAADRIQLNTLEQMGPFLVLLWLNALFVGPAGATVAGAIYVISRAVYPFSLGAKVGRGVRAAVMVSTVPGYAVMAYFMAALCYAVVTSLMLA